MGASNFKLTGVEQRVTSPYHPQANGLVERQKQTIKNFLVKVLEYNPEIWPQIMEWILFALCVSPHFSIKYSPFMLMCNRESVLPIDLNHNLDKDESKERENREGDGDEEQPFALESTCCKWARTIEGKSPTLLSKIYINTWKPLGKPYNGKIIREKYKILQFYSKQALAFLQRNAKFRIVLFVLGL